MTTEVSSVCEIGLQRKQNQDAILAYQNAVRNFALFLVADGMGGYANGELASGLIVSEIRKWLSLLEEQTDFASLPELLQSLRMKMAEINRTIWTKWSQKQICGSTCVILILHHDAYGVYSVGDSRVYLSRDSRCIPVTRDDVWQNQQSIQEKYSPEEMRDNPDYGKLTRAVGSRRALACSLRTDRLADGDLFALCSDGVYKMCSAQYLNQALVSNGTRNLDSLRDMIMREVYRNGAKDNASLILVRCSRRRTATDA
ncbi:MAG: serine/threonine-protein phosphatase [Oscillospiraceae bacterium]|nr:serine/threonine-protein phosphatase [Oscillospiraceae bacterium]